MTKYVKLIKSFLINSANCVAPYTVFNGGFGKCHFCWTYKQALEWLDCYDVDFGATYVLNFNGSVIVQKA